MRAGQANSNRGAAPRRHIIERPRLTRLLAAADAPIVLLVAPAGYGKTTLARQWLMDKQHVWHAATAASADVAALAARLGEAGSALTSSDPSKLDERLHLTPDAEKEVEVLTDFVARCFSGAPDDAWLAIDDYHLLTDSPAAEALVSALPNAATIKLLVTTRRRPSWATARRIMYGEIYEISRHELAMDANEADELLQRGSPGAAPSLVALADGWPAVIGMASLTDDAIAPENLLEDSLYEFFAEEFFNTVDSGAQDLLCRVAVMPTIKRAACEALLGKKSLRRLDEAEQLGLVSRSGLDWYMHPLLRKFLLMKYRLRAPEDLHSMAVSFFDFALDEKDWDGAFAIATEFEMVELLEPLIRAGLDDLLSVGRIATLRKWVEAANQSGRSSAATRIAEAEIAFRDGSHLRAEALATEAVEELAEGDDLRARGLFRAGQAAYFSDNHDAALEHFNACVSGLVSPSLEREARWAAFIAALDSRHPHTLDYLNQFAKVRELSVNDAVRMANAEIVIAMNRDGVTEAVAVHARSSHLVGRATDPMIRTAFWNTYGWALALNSRYPEARRAAAEELKDAEAYRLSFVEPHAQLLAALAAVGLRDLSQAETLLECVFEFARRQDDLFLLSNASAVLARLHVAREDCAGAAAATSTIHDVEGSNRYGEYLSVQAVVLAALGRNDAARAAIDAVPKSASWAEAQAFSDLATVIVACNENNVEIEAVNDAIARVQARGQHDALVTAYRAFPKLIELAVRSGNRRFIASLLDQANDGDLKYRYGVAVEHEPRTSPLSRREEQVLDLVSEGRTNEEVARLLFISPVTVKAHLRHIYEKLGVRNRVEAVARRTKERVPQPK